MKHTDMTHSPDLSDLVVPGARISVRATPKASRERLTQGDGILRVYVTAAPEAGKANEAVRKFLAKALGIPKSRLRLVAGATSRDKVFQVED